MYLQRQFALLLAAVALANAQNLSGVPTCASNGALSAAGATGCAVSDIACFCKSTSFTSALESSAKNNCSAADYATAINAARSLCSQAGVTIFGTSSSSSPTPSPSPATNTSMSSNSVSASSAPATTTSTNDRTASNTTGSVSISVTTRCKCEEETITYTPMPTPAPVATYTGAAARLNSGRGGEGALVGVMAAVGMAALL